MSRTLMLTFALLAAYLAKGYSFSNKFVIDPCSIPGILWLFSGGCLKFS